MANLRVLRKMLEEVGFLGVPSTREPQESGKTLRCCAIPLPLPPKGLGAHIFCLMAAGESTVPGVLIS